MSSNFHLHFVSSEQTFVIAFCEKEEASKTTVLVSGRNYELQGEDSKIAWLKAKIPSLNNTSEISLNDLQITLQNLGAKEITLIPRTNTVGIGSLNLSSEAISKEEDAVVVPGKGAVMHQLLESHVKNRGFAGTVLVVDHGKTILKSGYGRAKIEDNEPISSKTRFPIGSLTKPITSLAILKLVQQGAFLDPKTHGKITDPGKIKILDFLLKSFQPEDRVRDAWAEITLLDLMNHTSGLPSFEEKGEQLLKAKGGKKSTPLSPQEVIDLIRGDTPTKRGTYKYSNFGYHLLGKIIEEVSGSPYQTFMNNFLHDELHLHETGYVGTDESDSNYAEPLVWNDQEKRTVVADKDDLDPLAEAYSSGGLYSTVDDLQILSNQQIMTVKRGGTVGQKGVKVDKDPLTEFDFRQQFTCVNGWNVTSDDWVDSSGKPMQEIWKTGAVGGYGSLMVFYPNQNSSIVILSNQPGDVEAITTDLSHLLCLEGGSQESVLSHWDGLYHIRSWGLTFSISRNESQYVFRETHPVKHEVMLDASSNANQIVFPWGKHQETHSIKKVEDQLLLCGPDGSPIPDAVVDKVKLSRL